MKPHDDYYGPRRSRQSGEPGPEERGRRRGGRGYGGRGYGGPPEFGPAEFGYGWHHGRGEGRGRGPSRGRKGDVRNAILALLAEEPMNGYQLIQAISDKTDGLWTPGAGSVYPALGLLVDEGLTHEVEIDGRKAHELTDAGRTHVAEHAAELTDPWDQVTQPHQGYLDVRPEVAKLAMALKQVVMTGDQAQMTAARGILDAARRDIYRLLAGDATS